MRILYVMAGGKNGGAETAFIDMIMAMHEAGESVEVVTRAHPTRNARLVNAGIKIHHLPFGGKVDLYTPFVLNTIILKFKPDIVQCWMSRAAAHTPRWSPSMKIPRYVTFGRMGTPYKLKYYTNMDFFVALTPDIKTHITDHGVEDQNVRIIPNFAEVEDVDTPTQRADYGTPENAPLVLGLGRLHNDKAFDVLIKAAAQLPEIHVWIAGEGGLRDELEALIEELDLESRVKLLGWRNDRAALFQASDICAFISREEGFGTVFIQSWAQKTPLIASLSDGPRQYVKDGEDGVLVPIDDVDATVKAIKRVCEDKALTNALVDNGYQRYIGEFTKDICIQRYLEFYHDARQMPQQNPRPKN